MTHKMKQLTESLLTLALVLGLIPGMTLTAKADSTYDAYLVTEADTATTLQEKVVKFNGYDWYIIKDDSSSPTSPTITLLTKECVGVSDYGTNYTYKGSKIESMLSTYYSQNFTSVDSAVASAILTDPVMCTPIG